MRKIMKHTSEEEFKLSRFKPAYHCTFIKDSDLIYLNCNKEFAQFIGCKNLNDIIGKTDDDLPWKSLADELIFEDKKALRGESVKTVLRYTDFDNDVITFYMTIDPMDATNTGIESIIGTVRVIGTKLYQINEQSIKKKLIMSSHMSTVLDNNEISEIYFGFDELQGEILYFHLMGLSTHVIAKLLKHQEITIKNNIDSIKQKMECHPTEDIFMKALRYSYHKITPLSLFYKFVTIKV